MIVGEEGRRRCNEGERRGRTEGWSSADDFIAVCLLCRSPEDAGA